MNKAGGSRKITRSMTKAFVHFRGSPVILVVEVTDQAIVEACAGGDDCIDPLTHSWLLRVARDVPRHSRRRAVASEANR